MLAGKKEPCANLAQGQGKSRAKVAKAARASARDALDSYVPKSFRNKHTLRMASLGPMIESDRAPFGHFTANRLMAIVGHALLSNSTHGGDCPESS